MALRRDSKTMRYIIKSDKDLIEAIEMANEINDAIREEIVTSNMLREAATQYMVGKGMKQIVLPNGKVKKLVERMTRKWIGTRADLRGMQVSDDVKPLKELVDGVRIERGGKWVPMWNVITKRVPDPDKIDDLIAEGVLKEDEISVAFVEIPQKPYLQM